MPLLEFIPEEAIKGMYVCALRFDGYRYQEACLKDLGDEGLEIITAPIRDSLLFDRDLRTNLAAFFRTQRRLKEDDMTEDSRDHVLFDMLFLHLYKVEIPSDFRNEDYCAQWEGDHQEQAELIAAMVRDSFTSKPRVGTKFNE